MSRRARSLILALSLLTFPETLWRWLTGDLPGFAVLWEKEGADMDPNGRAIPPRTTTDEGGDMDPDG
ncbi:MAG TPA: hypothetical protein VJ725_33350 [Thermoanaerobaculia bacterium]|nr:hypothetical protein [Thermoanaerobaculia bacterium]